MHLALRVVLSPSPNLALRREVTIAADPSIRAPTKRSSLVRACISELCNLNSKLHVEGPVGQGPYLKLEEALVLTHAPCQEVK